MGMQIYHLYSFIPLILNNVSGHFFNLGILWGFYFFGFFFCLFVFCFVVVVEKVDDDLDLWKTCKLFDSLPVNGCLTMRVLCWGWLMSIIHWITVMIFFFLKFKFLIVTESKVVVVVGKKGRRKKMEETMAARYWCHICSQMVNPVMEADIKCPFSQVGEQA